jgi:hypothetical protein
MPNDEGDADEAMEREEAAGTAAALYCCYTLLLLHSTAATLYCCYTLLLLHSTHCTLLTAFYSLHSTHCTLLTALYSLHSTHYTPQVLVPLRRV